MPLNLPLPDWVPWWGQLVVLMGAILFGFAFLMMPFSVFGLKGRLDFLEAQLDDIHAELRMIAARLPDPERPPAREPVFEELVRPPPTRNPSPVQTPAQMSQPVSPPPPRQASPAPVSFRTDGPESSPPRFPGARELRREPSASTPPRFPASLDDRGPHQHGHASGDWDDEPASAVPRRPLRAITSRDPGLERDAGRDGGRDTDRQSGRDRFRSEPILRWPPPR